MNKRPTGIEIFKAGTHVASDGKAYTFPAGVLREIADSYNPQLAEAPLVVGHPKTDDPAYGWAQSLVVQGDRLVAVPHQVEAQFAEMVNDGRFKTVSASIYLPDTPGNPTPGKHYLRHIGFLGAQAPGVKGLRTPQFSEGDQGAVEFAMPMGNRLEILGRYISGLFRRLREQRIADEGVEAADRLIPQWELNAIDEITQESDDGRMAAFSAPPSQEHETMNDRTAEFAEREQQLATRGTSLDQREAALKKREDDARREDAVAFAEGLASKDVGKLLPRQVAGVVELLLALPTGTTLNFSEADGEDPIEKPAGEVLRDLLSGLPRQVDFSEKSRDQGAGGSAAADFAAPAGVQVDAGRLAIHQKALDYQREHPNTDYMAAVKAVSG